MQGFLKIYKDDLDYLGQCIQLLQGLTYQEDLDFIISECNRLSNSGQFPEIRGTLTELKNNLSKVEKSSLRAVKQSLQQVGQKVKQMYSMEHGIKRITDGLIKGRDTWWQDIEALSEIFEVPGLEKYDTLVETFIYKNGPKLLIENLQQVERLVGNKVELLEIAQGFDELPRLIEQARQLQADFADCYSSQSSIVGENVVKEVLDDVIRGVLYRITEKYLSKLVKNELGPQLKNWDPREIQSLKDGSDKSIDINFDPRNCFTKDIDTLHEKARDKKLRLAFWNAIISKEPQRYEAGKFSPEQEKPIVLSPLEPLWNLFAEAIQEVHLKTLTHLLDTIPADNTTKLFHLARIAEILKRLPDKTKKQHSFQHWIELRSPINHLPDRLNAVKQIEIVVQAIEKTPGLIEDVNKDITNLKTAINQEYKSATCLGITVLLKFIGQQIESVFAPLELRLADMCYFINEIDQLRKKETKSNAPIEETKSNAPIIDAYLMVLGQIARNLPSREELELGIDNDKYVNKYLILTDYQRFQSLARLKCATDSNGYKIIDWLMDVRLIRGELAHGLWYDHLEFTGTLAGTLAGTLTKVYNNMDSVGKQFLNIPVVKEETDEKRQEDTSGDESDSLETSLLYNRG